ncbi:MAG: radical SAM protein [Bacteroidota bacterium]|nr:radical SAM protein [Bacteroidota bacterium]
MDENKKLTEKLQLSRYTHFTEKNDLTAIYHSLRFHPLYLKSSMAKELLLFRKATNPAGFLQNKTEEEIENWSSLIQLLVQYGILVSSKETDDRTIAYYRDHIPKPGIYVAFFILTDACNFNCSYCFIEHDRRKNHFAERYMSESIALDGLDFFVEQIRKNKGQSDERKAIQFYGGEPLMNFKVLKKLLARIQEYKRSNVLPDDIELTTVTNGSLLTREVVGFLKEHGVGITISIDGDEFSTSNRLDHSGKPVYHRIMKGIENCKSANAHFALSVTLTEETIDNADRTMNTILKISPDRVGFNLLLAGDHFSNIKEGYALRASNFVINAFKQLRENGIVYEDNFIRKVESFAKSKVCVSDCGAVGGNQVIIQPDGKIGACEGFLGERKYLVSDIYDKGFDPAQIDVYQEWGKRKPLLMEKCQDCIALGICGGGCLVGAIKNKGDIFALDDIKCSHMKNTVNWLIWDLYDNVKN